MDKNTRVCFVVQRYGLEVNGGAELLCRQFAERMKDYCDNITIVTTKAIDYMTWKNEYHKSEEDINGVHVIRFPVNHPRHQYDFINYNNKFNQYGLTESEEYIWLEKQGPYCPLLINYLKDHKDDYDIFIFNTYLYYPTVLGIPEVAGKAICIPDAHDEPYLKMKIFNNVFLKSDAFFFNTEEERKLIHSKYHNENIPSDLGGVGIELPDEIKPERFKGKYGIDNFIVYVGRIDQAKGCGKLFKYFTEYKKRNPGDLKLVLMGKPAMDIPDNPDIVSLGFVSDEDKFDGIAAAKILVLPSQFESLSIVVLEAMAVKTNVMVNAQCPVLKGHCIKSNGAFYYNNFFEFEAMINYLFTHPEEAQAMKENAWKYVQDNYQWPIIMNKLCNLIDTVRAKHR